MDNGAFGLMLLQIHEVIFQPWYTPFERCVMDFFCDLHEAFHGRRRSNQPLPFSVNVTMDEPTNRAIRTVVLQVLDSTGLYVYKETPEVQPTGKHLHEMHVVVWGSELEQQDLADNPNHPMAMVQETCIHVLLDKVFEVSGSENNRASYLGIMMSKSRFFELEIESRMLEDRINYDLELGYQVAFGLTPELARRGHEDVKRAKKLNHLCFGALQSGTISLSQVAEFDDALPFLKRFAFTGYPRAVDFRQNMMTKSMYTYLRYS